MAKAFDPWAAWFEGVYAMNAASITIAIRIFRIQQAMFVGDWTGGRETRLMTREKVKAASDGYLAGLQAMTGVMMTPWESADAYANAVAKAGAASARPALRKARSNAERLTRF